MKKVLYVPLDDRPVNLDDVIVQGRSAGIEVITPCIDDIKNRMDSEKTDSDNTLVSTFSPTFGNTTNIRQFILDHAADVDGFIITVDMLAYGGLIGSRRLRTNGGSAYPDYDPATTHLLDTIRLVKKAYPRKPIYVLDTIMRLATTTYVENVFQNAYDESRNFMKQPRKSVSEFSEILEGYDTKPDGTPYEETVTFNKEHYYDARRHKFKSNVYILDRLARLGHIDFLAIGVDDSSTQGVQANEIDYVEGFITESLGGENGQSPERAIILPDADGLGHSLMARMAHQLLRVEEKPKYSVHYFGRDGSTIINPYEYMSVHQNIQHHVDIIGGQLVTSSPDAEVDVEIVAITDIAEVPSAVSRIEANGSNRIPTVVIDFVGGGAANAVVTEALLESPYTGQILGYSGWNTAGNKIGIALGMAQARYAFLITEKRSPALSKAVNAHGSLLFKRFLKDYYYKALTIGEIRQYSRANALYTNIPYADGNFLLFNSESDYAHVIALLKDRMQTHTNTLAAKIAFQISQCPSSNNIRQIKKSKWSYAEYESASLSYENPSYIWDRAFEITLNPKITLS